MSSFAKKHQMLVGQQVISAAQDARAETDHETLTALHTINVQQLQILELLATISSERRKTAHNLRFLGADGAAKSPIREAC